MRIAVVGTGIAGMVAAHLLGGDHDLTVYESNDRLGGHTDTATISLPDGQFHVDTGFIVCNDRTYPNFLRLLAKLNVPLRDSTMSFSVHDEETGLEYNGGSWNGLFAQRLNLIRPSFWRMVREILRFNREAPDLLKSSGDGPTLRDYLTSHHYGAEFIVHYLLPMGAAIWSMPLDTMWDFPARFFVQFFQNHGLLSVYDRPQWLTVVGGSKSYIDKLTHTYRDRVRLNSPVRSVRRFDDHVEVESTNGVERFDHVVLAAHSDQSLRMLADPSDAEREILGAIPYQENEAVLHTDESLLPRNKRAWASWNYHRSAEPSERPTLTYWMNLLQGIACKQTLCVTLNRTAAIRPETILKRVVYHHPVYQSKGIAAQKRWHEISGVRRTHYCGAYWSNGFHEDGVRSALAVGQWFGKSL